ncbi:hypothetical protein FOQG_17853 [Fusarium oxysporum f. sp. raphani 54005]|uniref:Uncharacterized protein n=2 Tax=Fusarium oxysporum TaxID=5507 RepID=X0B5P4_FUSOX|nr:hypothetical protein FOMG_18119 [Fusarium oxysporum f. sp. melonis 26406]EXK77445.1 hypothetical protein FOQG_17853 [Fusarium oxysporum f. sp. raphani 54005]
MSLPDGHKGTVNLFHNSDEIRYGNFLAELL